MFYINLKQFNLPIFQFIILVISVLQMLMNLGIEKLVLPAVPSVLNTWTASFGFSKMTTFERLKFVDYSFLDFQDTVMCQKTLTKSPSAELSVSRGILGILAVLSYSREIINNC